MASGEGVSPNFGGTGLDTSASTGIAIVTAGTWSTLASLPVGQGGTGGTGIGSMLSGYQNGTLASNVLNGLGVFAPIPQQTNGILAANGAGVSVADQPICSVFDPTGRWCYCVNGTTAVVYQFAVNSNGQISAMSPASVAVGAYPPNFLVMDPLGRFLYASQNTTNGTIYQFGINPQTGALTYLTPDVTLVGVATMAIAPNGKFLWASTYAQNTIYPYSIGATGLLTAVGSAQATGFTFTAGIAVDTGGVNLYCVSASPTNSLQQYSISSTGTLTQVGSNITNSGGTNAYGNGICPVVDPMGRFLWLGNQSGLTSYFRLSATGVPTYQGVSSTAGPLGPFCADVLGRFVYTANAVAVQCYQVNSLTGSLDQLSSIAFGATSPALALDPSGRFLVVAQSTPTLLPLQVGIQNAASDPYAGLFGTGADGALSISSGTTVLTKDTHYTNVTLTGTAKIALAGFRMFVNGVLDLSAAPASAIVGWASATNPNGGNASANTAGAAGATTAIGSTANGALSSVAGKAGGTGAGIGGTSNGSYGVCYPGMAGTAGGGAVGGGSTNAGGAAVGGTSNVGNPLYLNGFHSISRLNTLLGGGLYSGAGGTPGSAGGAGGGDGTNLSGASGGSGGPSGWIVVFARTINRSASSAAGAINANGGNGGNGGNASATGNSAGGAGSGGASGGMVYLCYEYLTGAAAATNLITASGGNGGTGGNGNGTGKGGGGGGGGSGGGIFVYNVLNHTVTTVLGAAGTASTAASGTTAGVAGAAGTAAVLTL